MIDENDVGAMGGRGRAHLVGLAAAHEEPRIGALAPPDHRRHRQRTGGTCQLLKLAQIFRINCGAEPQPYEHRALTAPGALEHSYPP